MQFNKYTHTQDGDGSGDGKRAVAGMGTRTGSGRAEERRRSAINRTRVVGRHVGKGGDLGGKRKKRTWCTRKG